MPEFDLAIVGAGSAGLSVANVAARLGLRVALIERADMGGDCLNAGCVPSKALLAAAHAAQAAARAGRYGVRLPPPEVEWSAVRAHVRRAIDAIAPMDSAERYRALGATVLMGHARFVAPDALEVGGGRVDVRRLTARRIVVAAGSRAAVPPIPGLADVPHLTNETLFDLAERPAHLLILGAGAIAAEMAQAHAGLGCRVTMVGDGPFLAREEPELADALADVLRADGVELVLHAAVARVEPGPALVLADGRRIVGSHLLVAAGRTPNLDGLDLDAGRVRATARGIATDQGLRSPTNHRVFAAGDIADPDGIGPRYLTHAASHHASLIVRRAIFRLPVRLDPALPRAVYTDPELAQAGVTEAEARAAGADPTVLRWPMAENDRSIAEGRTAGLVRLVAVGGRVVGAGILAPHAGEMIGLWTMAIACKTKLSALAGMVAPYPTRAEAGKRAAGTAFEHALFAPRTRRLARLISRLT